MPRIQDQVAENRRDVSKIDGRFVTVPDRRDQNLVFGRNGIRPAVAKVEVYTRDLNNALVSGHPNGDRHGSGHGVSGDQRGDWTLIGAEITATEWTRAGRNAVRDTLNGQDGALAEIAIGGGTGEPSPADAGLDAETGRTFAYGLRAGEAFNEVRGRGSLRFSAVGDSGEVAEYGLFDSTGRLLSRTTTTIQSPSIEKEVRVDLTVRVDGDGTGSSVVTDDGKSAVADALQLESTVVGLEELAWGTGGTDPAGSDTALENEVLRKPAQRDLDLEVITVSAPQFEHEPSGQPYDYTEVGVFDNTGSLVWRGTFDSFKKTEDTRFTMAVGFRII